MAREVATFVRSVRDCKNKLLATPHRPERPGETQHLVSRCTRSCQITKLTHRGEHSQPWCIEENPQKKQWELHIKERGL